MSEWFDDIPVVGRLSSIEAAAKFRELGDLETAERLEQPGGISATGTTFGQAVRLWPFQDKPWQHTSHAFGFLPVDTLADQDLVPISHAGTIQAQDDLKEKRLKITLDRMHVAEYPGRGIHRILLDFYAQNQVSQKSVEHLHYNATWRVREGEHAGNIGYPIFVGLRVGKEGVSFKCYTVNVRNDNDTKFLNFLESDVFKTGLRLLSTVQPALAPLSGLALGITRSIATRYGNVPVQDIHMGLDFSAVRTRARLAEGSYIAVQIPESLETTWDWSEWAYAARSGFFVSRHEPNRILPYNYLVFGVSEYSSD